MIKLKTSDEIKIMGVANKIVHQVLDHIEKNIKVGLTTRDLDFLAEEKVKELGSIPTFKGYHDYPAALCVSVNKEIVHGIPGDRTIGEGDIVSVDFGATYNGFIGDAARTFIIGSVPEEVTKLVHETKRSLKLGIEQMKIGNRLWDISTAIASVAKENNYGNMENFCGHGIGTQMHEAPHVFNYVNLAEPNIRLQEGMVFALEPMFTLGTHEFKILDDKWTAVTLDGSLAAHWEVSVAITKEGPYVLGKS